MGAMPERKKTGPLKAMVFALLPAALLLLALEIAARVLPGVPPPAGAAGFMGAESLFVEDPVLMWRVKPGLRGAHATNSGGFRGGEFRVRKEPGEYRVMALGDSTTWGWGVKEGECYPARLERLLGGAVKGRKVTVMNGGVPGYTSFQGRLLFETELKKYRSDLVVTYFGVNDVTAKKGAAPDSAGVRPPAARLLRVLRKSALYADVRNYLLRKRESGKARAVEGRESGGVERRVSPREFGENMESLRAAAEAAGARVLNVAPLWNFRGEIRNDLALVLFTPKGTYIEESAAGPLYVAEPVFDPLPAFAGSGLPAGALFLDYCHLSPEGHRVLAESLAERIKAGL